MNMIAAVLTASFLKKVREDMDDIVKVLARYCLLQFCILHLQHHFKIEVSKFSNSVLFEIHCGLSDMAYQT